MRTIHIGAKSIGPDSPVFVMAEAGVNHNAEPEKALELVDAAAASGADAVKFQTYTAAKLVTKDAPKYYVDTMAQWQRGEAPTGYQSDEFSQLDSLSDSAYQKFIARCNEKKILFLSTPFDEEGVDFLDSLGVQAFKVASGDITNHRLLAHVARKGKPVLLSTGCSTVGEIEEALSVIADAGNKDIVLMHCTLSYPTAPADANLNAIRTMQAIFPDIPVGFSDHTLGTVGPIVAAALGARIIEKHFTLDKSLGVSTDHFMSVDPPELARMVKDIRDTELMLGSPVKRPVASEELARRYARRSVVAKRTIAKGSAITEDDLILKRPGTGIEPKFFDVVVGLRATCDIETDTVLAWEMLS